MSCLPSRQVSDFIRSKNLGVHRIVSRTKRPLQIYNPRLVSRRSVGCKSGSSVYPIASSPSSTGTIKSRGDSDPSPPIFDPARSPHSRSEAPSHHPGCHRPTSPVHLPCSELPETRSAYSAPVAVRVGTKPASRNSSYTANVCAPSTATGEGRTWCIIFGSWGSELQAL